MKRIFFVGVHNKPGMEPLDSRSRSGKMIDRVIAGLQTEVGLFEAEFIKTNLFDSFGLPSEPTIQQKREMNFYDLLEPREQPKPNEHVLDWAKRVGWKDGDIVICLGAIVHKYFRWGEVRFIAIGHPSGVWSKLKQEEYIINAAIKVSEVINKTVIL